MKRYLVFAGCTGQPVDRSGFTGGYDTPEQAMVAAAYEIEIGEDWSQIIDTHNNF